MDEARILATEVLPDGHQPMAAMLLRHPRGALIRRLGWATYGPALASGALLLFVLTGALPGWVWPLPLALLPLTLALAVAAYRSLGHAWAEPYLVVRRGALNWHTVALQERAVIGWTLRQSILQRWGNRMTAGVSTAAGSVTTRCRTPASIRPSHSSPPRRRCWRRRSSRRRADVADDRVGHPVVQRALAVAEQHERVDHRFCWTEAGPRPSPALSA